MEKLDTFGRETESARIAHLRIGIGHLDQSVLNELIQDSGQIPGHRRAPVEIAPALID